MKKTMLITGASSGIGKDASLYFAQQGWNVIATMRSPEKEKGLTELDNVLVIKLEVTDPASIDAAIKIGIEKFGKIDALINNAGYRQKGLFNIAAGIIDTNLWNNLNESDREAFFKHLENTLLLKRVGKPEDVAQAFIYLMKQPLLQDNR